MKKAMTAVLEGGVSIRKASAMFGVPKSTLGDRISGRVLEGSHPSRYLTDEEEEELVSFLLGCSSIGYPKTIMEVLALVQRILSSRGCPKRISYGWWEGFKKRHPNVSLRSSSALTKPRLLASSRAVIDHYFDLLEETLSENGLSDRPYQIFNMDESGMPLAPKPPKTIHKKGSKIAVSLTSSTKDQITVVCCVNAAGQCIPPMVIWDRKQLRPELTVGEVPGTVYGLANKGWMDQYLFEQWFKRHFLKYAPPVRPLLLLMDGHASHYAPDAIKFAAEEKILVFVLPPNTTHLSQPLDKGVFGPLKVAWKNACHKYMSDNPGLVVQRYVFSRLFHSAWMESMTIRNIQAGFRTTGVYPIDRNAIVLPGEEKKSLAERTGLSFIPFYTPSKRGKTSSVNEENGLASGQGDSYFQLAYKSDVASCLKVPSPLTKMPHLEEKCCARLLTSIENKEQIELKNSKKAVKGAKRSKSVSGKAEGISNG